MKASTISVLFTILISTSVHAESYVCNFQAGAQGSWSGVDAEIETVSWTSGEVSIIQSQQDSGRFTMRSDLGDIDFAGGNSGFGLTLLGNHRGIPMLISIFDTPAQGTQEYFAVISRHVMIITSPQPTQYHGLCRIE